MRPRALWTHLRLRAKDKRLEVRRGKRYRTTFIPRPDPKLLEDIESSFKQPPPKE